MATFHDRPTQMNLNLVPDPHFMTVKGAPDVVINKCSQALWHGEIVPMDQVRQELLAANQQLSEKGLRVSRSLPARSPTKRCVPRPTIR